MNVLEHSFFIKRSDQEKLKSQRGCVLWLTGLSGSGKSSVANELQKELLAQQKYAVILDGDSIRAGLCKNLGFSQEDRTENLRRVAEVAKLFAMNGDIVICCFITPLVKQREMIQEILQNDYQEIYIKTEVEICEKRDPKGLYKKARSGTIADFTGVNSEYQEPTKPTLVIENGHKSLKENVQFLMEFTIELTKL